jgi:hypothetical protein
MTNLPPSELPHRHLNGRTHSVHVTLDMYHRLSISLTTDPRYARDEVVQLLRDDELSVDTLTKSVSHKGTGEIIGTFQVIEEESEVEYVELEETP